MPNTEDVSSAAVSLWLHCPNCSMECGWKEYRLSPNQKKMSNRKNPVDSKKRAVATIKIVSERELPARTKVEDELEGWWIYGPEILDYKKQGKEWKIEADEGFVEAFDKEAPLWFGIVEESENE